MTVAPTDAVDPELREESAAAPVPVLRRSNGADPESAATVRVFEEAVDAQLFKRLARAVREVGDERLERNYNTTFWLPNDAKARNVAEEAIGELIELAAPPAECIGVEWWLGRLAADQRLPFHFDRDLSLSRRTGQYVPPIYASILYLTSVPSSPTVILGQAAGPDGKTRIPRRPTFRKRISAVANRYVVFPGALRHGVVPRSPRSTEKEQQRSNAAAKTDRLSLLVNYWDRRPHAPICTDYDGAIYANLRLDHHDDTSLGRGARNA